MRRAVVAVITLVLFAGFAFVIDFGWTAYERQRTFEPTTALDEQCDDVPDGAQRITFPGADGFILGAALVGPEDAKVGVVLRQGASQKICEWLPFAAQIADETGARVLLFDRRGRGSSPGEGDLSKEPTDTRIAVSYLRHAGAPDVALVASSMGNSIMFSAVPSVEPTACAVISISPVLVSADGNGTVDGSALAELPRNVWITWERGNPGVADNAKRIVEAARETEQQPKLAARSVQTLPVNTDHHSRQLVLNHPEVLDFLIDGVNSCR